MTEESLFHDALSKSPAQRAGFLDQACAGRPALRASVEALLAAHEAPGSLMDRLSPSPAETMQSDAGKPQPAGAPDSQPAPDRTTAMRPPAGSEGIVIAGRYKLRQQIGEGGMGTVWMADQTSPVKRKVAVKLIRVERGQSKTILARFEAERQAIALMDHPHIARLLDAGTTDDGSPFFVMELVKGIPLNEFCDQHRLTVQERLNLFLQICSAVQHAHQKGIIHRDLKPSNMLVESHDGKPVPKVIDFGLAKATTGLQLTDQSMFTAFGSVMGTPLYMAPEQASFNAVDVDTRADVFALGIILYELLTGTTPITRETLRKAALDEMMRLVREQEAPTPSSRLSSAESAPNVAASRQMEQLKLGRFVKGELDWIVMKALSKERNRRYETANGFAQDIERFLNHEPVQAGPPSAGYRLRKFVRRNRSQVIAASLVLLALVGGAVAYLVAGKLDQALPLYEEALKLAKAKLGPDHPTSLNIMVGLAWAHKAAGQLDLALPLFEETLKRSKAKLGPDHPDTIASTFILAVAYQAAGKNELALPLLEETLKLKKAKLGPDHPDTLASMNNLAVAYQAAGKNELALPLLEATLKLMKAKLGPDHPSTLATMRALAIGYRASGRRTEELALLEDVLPRRRTALGPHHRDTLMSMHDLAWSYCRDGRYDVGLPLYAEALPLARTYLGERDAHTLGLTRNFALAYQAAGKPDLALPLWEQVSIADPKDTLMTIRVAALQAWFGQDDRLKATGARAIRFAGDTRDPLVAERSAKVCFLRPSDDKDQFNAAVALARRAVDLGQKNPALPYFQMALGIAQYRSGLFGEAEQTLAPLPESQKRNPHIVGAAGFFQAMALFRQGRTGDATKRATITTQGMKPLPLDDRNPLADSASVDDVVVWLAYKEAKQLIGFDAAPDRSGQLAKHGLDLLEQRKFSEAEPILRESLAIREKTQPDDWRTFYTRSMLGGSLLGQKKYAEAEPLLLKGYEGLKVREKTIPPQAATRIPEALDRLIELYTATSKTDEVKKWQAERAKYPQATPK